MSTWSCKIPWDCLRRKHTITKAITPGWTQLFLKIIFDCFQNCICYHLGLLVWDRDWNVAFLDVVGVQRWFMDRGKECSSGIAAYCHKNALAFQTNTCVGCMVVLDSQEMPNIPTGTAPLRADAASYKLQVGGPYHFHQCVGRAANYHEKIPSLIPSCVVLGWIWYQSHKEDLLGIIQRSFFYISVFSCLLLHAKFSKLWRMPYLP